MDSRQEIIYDIQALGTDSLDQLLSKARSLSLEMKLGTTTLEAFAAQLEALKGQGKSTAQAIAEMALKPEVFEQGAKIAADVFKGIAADAKAAAKEDEDAWKEAARIYEETNDARAKSDQDYASLRARLLREETAASRLAAQQERESALEVARIRKEQSSGEEISERQRVGLKGQLRQQEVSGEKLRAQQLREGLAEEMRIRKTASDAEAVAEQQRAGLAAELRKEQARSWRTAAMDQAAAVKENAARGGGGGGFFSAIAPDSPLGGFARGASGLGFFGSASFFAGDITRRAVEELGRMAVETTHEAREMENLASRFGITAGEAQKLTSAGNLVGLKFESINAGSRALGTALESPQAEGKRAAEALDKLGISIRNTDGSAREMGPVFMEVLRSLSQIPDTATRVALANQILGRGAKEIEPLIADLGALTNAVENLGIGSDEQLHRLSAADKQLEELHETLLQLRRDSAEAIVPLITPIIKFVVDTLTPDTATFEARRERFIAGKYGPPGVSQVVQPVLHALNLDPADTDVAMDAITKDANKRAAASAKSFERSVVSAGGEAAAKRNRAKFGESIEGMEFDLSEARKKLKDDLQLAIHPHGAGEEVVTKAGDSIEKDRLEVERLEAALKKARKQGTFHSDQYAEKLAAIIEEAEAALRTPTQVADLQNKREATALVESFRREHKGAMPPARDLDRANAAFAQRREVAEDKEHDQDVKREEIENKFNQEAPFIERKRSADDSFFRFRESIKEGERDLAEQKRARAEALRAQFDSGQEQAQLNRGRARITQIQAGPADQGRAAIQNFNLRQREIEQEHQYELAVVKTMDAESQKAAAQQANHKAHAAQIENEIDLQVKLAEAQKQREEKIRSNAEGAFRALISKDGGGIADFVKAQVLGMATTVAGNVGVEAMKNIHLNLPDKVLKGEDGKANVLGRVLEGTPFGINHEQEIKEAQAQLKDSNLLLKASVDANTKALGGEVPAGEDGDLVGRTAHTATTALHKTAGAFEALKHLFHKPQPAALPPIVEPEPPEAIPTSIIGDTSPDLGESSNSHISMAASLDALTAIIGGTPPSGGSAAFSGDPDSLIGHLRRPVASQAHVAPPNPFSPFGPSETISAEPSAAPAFDLGSLLAPAPVATIAPATSVSRQSPVAGATNSVLSIFRDAFRSSSTLEKNSSSVERSASSNRSVENNTSSTAPSASGAARPAFDLPDGQQSSPAARISSSVLKVFRDVFHSSDRSSVEKSNSQVEKNTSASSSVEKSTSLPNVDSGSGTEGREAATLGGLMAAVQPNAAGSPALALPGAAHSPMSIIASAVPIVRDVLGLFHSPGMAAPGGVAPQDRDGHGFVPPNSHGFPTVGHQAGPSATTIPGAPRPAFDSIADKLSVERENSNALRDSTSSIKLLDADIKKLDLEIARLIAQEAQCGCGSKQQPPSAGGLSGGLGGVLGSLGGLLGGLGGGGGAESSITSVLSGAFGSDGTPILEELGGSSGIGALLGGGGSAGSGGLGGLGTLLGGGGSIGSGGLSGLLGSLGKAPAFTGPNSTFGGLTQEDLGNLGDFNPSELGQLDNSAAGTAPNLGLDSIAGKLGGGGKGKGGLGLGGVLAAGAGTFQAIKGFQQGGGKGIASGIGGSLTAAAGIASMIPGGQIAGIALGIAGGIADLVSGLLPDPKEERKKALTNEIDQQYKYIKPAEKDYYFSMGGGGSDQGIGGVARQGGQTVVQTVTINTMDSVGFGDFLKRNTNAFSSAMNYALTNSGNQTLNQTLSKVVSSTPR